MHGAAKHGCLTIMKWLKRKGCPFDDPDIMISAVKYGSLRNMKWLLENGCRPIDNPCAIFGKAAKHGSLDIMKWLLDIGCSIKNSTIMIAAAEYGSLVNMIWLVENGCPIDIGNEFILKRALSHGSFKKYQVAFEKEISKTGKRVGNVWKHVAQNRTASVGDT